MTLPHLNVRARYLIALGMLALCATLQIVVLSRLTLDQRQIGVAVNYAGRQRMLVQDTAIGAIELVRATGAARVRSRRAALLATAAEIERRHAQLAGGDPAIMPRGWPPPAVRAIYQGPPLRLGAQIAAYLAHVRRLARSPAPAADTADVAYLMAQRATIVRGQDAVVAALAADGNHREMQLLAVEAGLFVFKLGIIAFTLFVLFIPMERRIAEQHATLVSETVGLAAVVAGSRRLAETLAVDSLVARFIEGAERLLGTRVSLVGEALETPHAHAYDVSLAALDSGVAALVEQSWQTHRLAHDDGLKTIALGIDVFDGAPRLAIVARRLKDFRPTDLAALELFATNLMLAAHNAVLFADLEARGARVAELDKLKSDLIAMLAHDFRGPLTSIIGYAELMQEGMLAGDDLNAAAGFIAESAWRLSTLASDTLTMSLLERNQIALERAPENLVALVTECVAATDRTGRVRIVAQPDQIWADVDARRIRQVLENVIGNALKYAPDGTPVDVRIEQQGAVATVGVSDRGIGIPADEIEHVFDRFSRATNARHSSIHGSGFGLYISKMFVEMHGGTLSVQSALNAGSTFTVRLPALVAPPLAVGAPQAGRL